MGWQDMVGRVALFSVGTNAVAATMAQGFAQVRNSLLEGQGWQVHFLA